MKLCPVLAAIQGKAEAVAGNDFLFTPSKRLLSVWQGVTAILPFERGNGTLELPISEFTAEAAMNCETRSGAKRHHESRDSPSRATGRLLPDERCGDSGDVRAVGGR